MFQQIIPYFGYAASIFLIIALLVKTDTKFRIFNLLGNIAFITYGIVLHAWPVLITNSILFCINLYYLNKLYRYKEYFDLVEFKEGVTLTEKFFDFFKTDIDRYFPSFDQSKLKGNFNFVVLRDLVIANIFSAELLPNGDAVVAINYTIPKYRDYKIGKFIFEREKRFLISKGVKKIVYTTVVNKGHEKFLKGYGFVKAGNGYEKVLNDE